MALRPKVFVTRLIPEVGLQRIKQECEAEVWTDPLPPPYAVLKQKVAGCEGLVALLTDKIDDIERQLDELPPVIIIRLRNMNALDGTGLMAMERIAKVVRASGRAVIFCGALPQPKQLMEQSRFAERVGAENVLPNITEALERARVAFPETKEELRMKWDQRAATASTL